MKSLTDIRAEVGDTEFQRFLTGARRALNFAPERVLEHDKRVAYITRQIVQRYDTYKMMQEVNRQQEQETLKGAGSGRRGEAIVTSPDNRIRTSPADISRSQIRTSNIADVAFPYNIGMPEEGCGE